MALIKLNQDIRDVLSIITNAREGRTENGKPKPLSFEEVGLSIQVSLVYSAARDAHRQAMWWSGSSEEAFEIKSLEDERRAASEASQYLSLRNNALGFLYRASHYTEAVNMNIQYDTSHMGVDGDNVIRGGTVDQLSAVAAQPHAWAFNKLVQQGCVPLICDGEDDNVNEGSNGIMTFSDLKYRLSLRADEEVNVDYDILRKQGDLVLNEAERLIDNSARWVLIGWLKSIAETGMLPADWKRADDMLKMAMSLRALSIDSPTTLFRYCIEAFKAPDKRLEFHNMFQQLLAELGQIEFAEAEHAASTAAKREILFTQRAKVIETNLNTFKTNGASIATLTKYLVGMSSHLSPEEMLELTNKYCTEEAAPAEAKAKAPAKAKITRTAKAKASAK